MVAYVKCPHCVVLRAARIAVPAAFRIAIVLAIILTSLPAAPAWAQSSTQGSVAGDVGPSFTESSAAVFAGALQMASVEPSSGVLRTAIPLDYPAARGMAQPALGLYYSSASGIREAGMGWGLNLPSIERRGPANGPPIENVSVEDPYPEDIIGTGIPGENTEQEYNERYALMTPFALNGELLLPICEVASTRHPCTTPDASVFPDWVEPGAIYFRLQQETNFVRVFWSRNRKTWHIQMRGGEVLELGQATTVPLDGDEFATEYDVRWRQHSGGLYVISVAYRWQLARAYDPPADGGLPRNLVVYQWRKLGETGLSSLTDVYYTPPATPEHDYPLLGMFAHHIRLEWERPIQIRNAYAPIWRATHDYHITRIDMASKSFDSPERPRQMVRRYHLTYAGEGQHSYLNGVQMEGRCDAPVEEENGRLPASTCARLPAVTMRYSAPESNRIPDSVVVVPSVPLAEGQNFLNMVPVDLNNDSLPDFVQVKPEVNSAQLPAPADRRNRILIDNGTWHVPDWIRNESYAFTRFGYTFTGDWTSRAETGVIWHLPTAVGATNFLPARYVPHLGEDGWVGLEPTPGQTTEPHGLGRIQLVGDINGDGLLDLLNYADEFDSGSARGPSLWWPAGVDNPYWGQRPSNWDTRARIGMRLAVREPDGRVTHADAYTCFGPSYNEMAGGWPNNERSVHLADMNSDSLADMVVVDADETLRYWPSDGRGNFTACRGVGCTCSTATTYALSNSMFLFNRIPNQTSANTLVADVSGDGYADFISWTRDELRIHINFDGWLFSEPIIMAGFWFGGEWASAVENNAEIVTIADMNGNGINDIVTVAGDDINSLDLHRLRSIFSIFAPDAWAPRPGLLIEIDNGLGAKTSIAYESTADMQRIALITNQPWAEPLPQIMQVVQRMTTTSNLPGAQPSHTFYSYDDPAWDGWERRLRGFRKVSVYQGDPQTVTEYTFFIPPCPDRFCGSPDVNFGRLRAASGQLLTAEVRDSQNRYLSTASYSYDVQELAQGMRGGAVRMSSLAQVDTRIYDTNDWDPINAGADQVIHYKAREGGGPIWTGRTPIRSRNNVLLRSTVDVDEWGNVITQTDHGRTFSNGTPIDDAVVTTVVMLPLRQDWRFLPERARTEPFAARPGIPADQPRTLLYSYDGAGRLSSVSAILQGTLPLARYHEDPTAAVAPAPPGASYNTLALLDHFTYDAFDNIVRHEAPAGTCVFYDYEPFYAQLVTGERVAADGCTGTRIHIAGYTWDAGLQTILTTIEPSGAVSQEVYDGMGRWVAGHLPDPLTGSVQAEPSISVQYHIQPGGPAQRVRTEVRGSGGNNMVEWGYTDGFGRPLLTLRQADAAAGDGGAWIAAGLPERNYAGSVIGTYGPWFYSGDPANHPLTTPNTPRSTIKLDSFGRPVEFRRADGTLSGQRIYLPLALESRNPSGHWSRATVDGHGRLREQRTLVGARTSVITIDYLVGGEAARITRESFSPLVGIEIQPPTVVRWMQYDSLGRMVLNAEANTATGFRADPADATSLRAWRYAYDWSGRVVGTSDARGCGWNNAYDRLGRLVAQDLSPCLRSQAAYTPANLTEGTGTEAFYRYDAPEPGQTTDYGTDARFLIGQLVSVQDRAAHTRFAYDARGRITGVARRLARPAAFDALWPGALSLADRYTAEWFRSSAGYDDASRMTALSTGATAPEMLDTQGQSRLTFSYSKRGVVTSVGGSYGDLVTGMVYDVLSRPQAVTLGDVAKTQLQTTYTPAGALATLRATRTAPALWSNGMEGYTPPAAGEPPTTQTVLEDLRFTTDPNGLLTKIEDLRDPAAWPTGAKPVSLSFTYDNIWRLTGVGYQYGGGQDIQTVSSEANALPGAGSAQRPTGVSLTYAPLGGLAQSSDDANALFERSLGDIVRGGFENGPDRLVSAAQGNVLAEYDPAGNLVALTVKRATCAAASGLCSHRLVYDWDENGQLARARRWDFATIDGTVPAYPALPATPPAADLRYRYDSVGVRTLRSTVAGDGTITHSAWPLGLLRLEGASYDTAVNRYTRSAENEEIVVPGLARILYNTTLPGPSPLHVFLSVGDHLGSTSSVIDKATSELVERYSYLPYGGVEAAYRPARWAGEGTHQRFTGKEGDNAVALVYFGARYYMPNLKQWISPDPLTIQGLGLPDLNPYSYVGGRVTTATDANGLQPCIGREDCRPVGSGGGGSGGDVVQVGSGDGDLGSGPDPSEAAGRRPVEPDVRPLVGAPKNSGVAASPLAIPFWQALGRPDTWASTVDPSVIEGFNAGVDKHSTVLGLVGITAAASSIVLGGFGAAYYGGTGLFSAAANALRGFGNSLFVTSGRTALWFNELSLAEQGITIGGGGGAAMMGMRAFESSGGAKVLSAGIKMGRFGRARQIFAAAIHDAPALDRSTISVADVVNESGAVRRVISTNHSGTLKWLQNNLVLREGEVLVPWVRNGAHAELNGAEWAVQNGFTRGSFGTSTPGCPDCIWDMHFEYNLWQGTVFSHDNPLFPLTEILANPAFFGF